MTKEIMLNENSDCKSVEEFLTYQPKINHISDALAELRSITMECNYPIMVDSQPIQNYGVTIEAGNYITITNE